jgi:ATP-dependent Zn protease
MNKLRLIFQVFLLILAGTPLLADDKLDQLLKERKVLYRDFEYYKSQKSSFWGTQSKKDMKKAIDVLKKIIIKDNEVIKQINVQHTRRNVQTIAKTQVSQDFASELEYDNNRLKLLLDKTTFDYNRLLEEADDIKSGNIIVNSMMFFLVILITCLVFYIFKLRQRLKIEREETNIINIDSGHRRKLSGEGPIAAGN